METIFFSYGHDNYKNFIIKIRDYLIQHGFEVFVDSDKLRAGDDWEHKLEVAIGDHRKFIFFITPHSARRPDGYCLNEIAMALYHKKDIIPVMIDFEIPPLSIIRKQYIDFQDLSKCDKLDKKSFEEKMQHLVEVLKGDKNIDVEGTQAKIFSELQPIDFTQDFAKHKNFIGRKWVSENITKWIDQHPESRVLWIVAEAGYGKSAISVHLANTFKDVIGIHFCSYNFDKKKDPLNVVKTLAYQFQSQIPEYINKIEHNQIENKNAYELFEEFILNPLSYFKSDKPYIFIIDALDEATTSSGENPLADLIRDEFIKLPNNIRIIITSRPEPKLKQKLSYLQPIILDAQNEENLDDCKEFIKLRLIDNDFLKYSLNEEFIETILGKSQANMLYLTQFFEGINNGTIDINNPEKFPRGLNGIYESFFQRITKDEDEYDEKYAPVLEIMLAYQQPIPELLLIDILGLKSKAFKRIFTRLGAILKEDNGRIEFFHKSLKDWLRSDENYSFAVSLEEGEEKLASFMNCLTPHTYRKEYLSFFDFNIALIEYILIMNKSLTPFFKLIENSGDPKEIVDLLRYLGIYFYLYNEIHKAIPIEEKILEITKQLFQEDSKKWAEYHTTSLDSLANSYFKINKIEEAVQLEKVALTILEALYQENSRKWAESYTKCLSNLATFLGLMNKTREAIVTIKKALSILKPLYKENPDKWADDYSGNQSKLANLLRDINNLRESLSEAADANKILEQLYKENPDRWAASYAGTLNTLALSLIKLDYEDPAVQYGNKAVSIIEKLYNENNLRWANEYTIYLNNLANLWSEYPNIQRAIKYGEKALSVREQLYKISPDRWAEAYAMSLSNLGSSYRDIGKNDEAIELGEKSISILKPLFEENPDRFAEGYTSILNILALSYAKINNIEKGILFEEKALFILEKLYQKNPKRWTDNYFRSLNNLAISFFDNENIDKSLFLFENGINELRELYKIDKSWTDKLIGFLETLIYIHNNIGNSNVVEELEQEIHRLKENK